MRRRFLSVVAAAVASVVFASTAMAFECTNASKNPGAGVQVLLGPTGEIEWTTPGIAARIEAGLIDPDTGEGFHGLLGFDNDGDGSADVSIWFGVGPEGEIPLQAQLNGPACQGVTNIQILFAECLGG